MADAGRPRDWSSEVMAVRNVSDLSAGARNLLTTMSGLSNDNGSRRYYADRGGRLGAIHFVVYNHKGHASKMSRKPLTLDPFFPIVRGYNGPPLKRAAAVRTHWSSRFEETRFEQPSHLRDVIQVSLPRKEHRYPMKIDRVHLELGPQGRGLSSSRRNRVSFRR